jgi:hypothetical protein
MINRKDAKRIITLYEELDEVKAAKKKLISMRAQAIMTIYVGDDDGGVNMILSRELSGITVNNKEAALLKELKELAR